MRSHQDTSSRAKSWQKSGTRSVSEGVKKDGKLGGGEMAKPRRPKSKPPHRIHPEIWALLTPRETVILELYLVNPNDKAIAGLLKTAASTIRKHLSAIEQKAGVGSRAELLVFFLPPDR